jgi:hypothetical protein
MRAARGEEPATSTGMRGPKAGERAFPRLANRGRPAVAARQTADNICGPEAGWDEGFRHRNPAAPPRWSPIKEAAMLSRVPLLVFASLLVVAAGLAAQDIPFLPAAQVNLIKQEISGDAAYEHIRHNTQFHRSRGGADGLWEVAEYYAARAREAGLADVQLIEQAYSIPPWNARFADLWIEGEAPERIASTLQAQLHLADYSRAANVTAELVDVGGGTPAELDAGDVAGKIVLTYGPLATVMREAVGRLGALGVVWYPSPFFEGSGTVTPAFDRPDQLRWISVPHTATDHQPTFAFGLSLRQGIELRNRVHQSGEPVRVRAVVDASFDSARGSQPWQVMVEARIPGTEPGLGQDIMLTGHIQEEKFSANDDASGSAAILEIARALNRLIEEGRIPRPRRDLRFWWVTEFSSQRQYFADHPDAHRRMWVNVNQDMVGADQSQDVGRKQNITRLPASRFHFFNDVVETVVEHMVVGNTSELAQTQAGHALYPWPHLSKLGSRFRYNAEVIFYHRNTDHVAFNEAPIAVPGITFTNMPDRYIHSTDDDLWNIDPTQLGRNAAAAALIAYAMASAGAEAAPALVAGTVGRGAERLGRNLRLGLGWIASAPDRTRAYHDAVDQVRYAVDRESRAIRTLEEVGGGASIPTRPLLAELDRQEAQAIRSLDLAYRQATGAARPPARPASGAETGLRELRPVLVGGPAEFLADRGRIAGVPDLHPSMAEEVINLVDGNRTGLDIYRIVAAQAREAGAHYYGTATPEAVRQYLDNVAATGLIRLR